MHSCDGITWEFLEDGKEYMGSLDQNTVVHQNFKEPFLARTVRICPSAWNGHISTNFEVYFLD
jgi:hypothetical protein